MDSKLTFRLPLVISLVAVLVACGAGLSRPVTLADIRSEALQQGFSSQMIESWGYRMQVFHRGLSRLSPDADPVDPVVYIEGDGRAYVSRHRVSADPTPRNPVAFRLAAVDPSPAVIYIARPCQFVVTARCQPRDWTSHRYSTEIVAAMSGVLDQLHSDYAIRGYALVGYSGGGVIAALLAQQRADIDSLTTVAANLDHEAWTSHFGDTPLSGSLNPIDRAEALADLPQIHLAGRRDTTVPAFVIERFVQALPVSAPAEYYLLENKSHTNWPDSWYKTVCDLRFWQQRPGCNSL
ncbi:MAG: alpha/beta hydrolase [Gammaproteobacteria bacterium]